jgi:hypothetical protein
MWSSNTTPKSGLHHRESASEIFKLQEFQKFNEGLRRRRRSVAHAVEGFWALHSLKSLKLAGSTIKHSVPKVK